MRVAAARKASATFPSSSRRATRRSRPRQRSVPAAYPRLVPDQEPPVRVRVLGPVLLEQARTPTAPGPPKQRALLAALALHLGSAVRVDTLADLLWGDDVPGDVNASLHTYVAGLRRLLEPGRGARIPSALLVTTDAGYELRLPPAALDAAEFAERVRRAHARSASPSGEDLPAEEELVAELDAALALWRGTPYPELGEAADAERARLGELRLLALEERAAALLALGRHAVAAPELAGLVREHPLRERLWELHVTALAR